MDKSQPEPWLRGTHSEIPPVPRAVIHAIELAMQDLKNWCGDITEHELHATPFNLPSLASQLRHIARSVDRLLTYAEGAQLTPQQLEELNTESNGHSSRSELFEELHSALETSMVRIRGLGENSSVLLEPRTVGRKNLPSTVAGLLVHVADHTQRHVGQVITTTKIIRSQRV